MDAVDACAVCGSRLPADGQALPFDDVTPGDVCMFCYARLNGDGQGSDVDDDDADDAADAAVGVEMEDSVHRDDRGDQIDDASIDDEERADPNYGGVSAMNDDDDGSIQNSDEDVSIATQPPDEPVQDEDDADGCDASESVAEDGSSDADDGSMSGGDDESMSDDSRETAARDEDDVNDRDDGDVVLPTVTGLYNGADHMQALACQSVFDASQLPLYSRVNPVRFATVEGVLEEWQMPARQIELYWPHHDQWWPADSSTTIHFLCRYKESHSEGTCVASYQYSKKVHCVWRVIE